MLKIDELEEQCSEINREKEKNTQLKRRIEELESELREKETVSNSALSGALGLLWASWGDLHSRTEQAAVGHVTGPGSCLARAQREPGVTPRHKFCRAEA